MTNAALLGSFGDVSGQPLVFRNKIINGGMGIDQRNSGATKTFTAAAALAYSVDRWYGYCTGANVTGARVAGSGATQYRYQFTGAASVTAIGFGQRIEQQSCYDLAGNTATLSVDISNSLLTTVTWTAYYANTANTFGTLASPTRTQIATGTFTVSSTLTRYTASMSVPTAATTGIEIVFTVGAQTSGTWVIGNVQLEAGSAATPFEQRPVGMELSLCQRYLPAVIASSSANANMWPAYTQSANVFRAVIVFKSSTRVPVTSITISAASHFACSFNGGGQAVSAIVFAGGGTESATLDFTVGSASLNLPGNAYSNNASAKLIFEGAEL